MKLRNWNNLARNVDVKSYDALNDFDRVPRGNGRNYGDAALGEQVTDMRNHRREMKIEKDCLIADSGWFLSEMLSFCWHKGYWFPIVPGTQQVTLGGMVAADVHGKDHVSAGTLGRWIRQLTVRLSNGTIVTCSPEKETSLFRLTIGGMGSTGTILQAVIALEPIQGHVLQVNTRRFEDLEALLTAFEQTQERYSVAWADGFRPNRFVLSSASWISHASSENLRIKGANINVPQTGIRWVQPFLMRWYNWRYFRKSAKEQTIQTPEHFFFPLDKIGHWNRFYGRKGLLQFQFLVPKQAASAVWKVVTETLRANGFYPYLVVVKQHGTLESPGYLSFPVAGYSFALDLPRSEKLEAIICELHQQISAVGGRVYLTKDDLLTAEELNRMYPLANRFREELGKLDAPPIRSMLGDRLKLYELPVSSRRMQQTVFIIGANSDVGIKTAEYFREVGCHVVLFGHKIEALPTDYDAFYLDVAQPDLSVFEGKRIDIVLFTAGRLPDNQAAISGESLHETIAVNFTGNVQIAGYFAQKFGESGNGVIVGISSVAAVRGKGSNVVYGAAKAGWDNYLSGLRNFLHPKGVRVLTIRPGYIATKMTHGMSLPKSLTATPETVAKVIVRNSLRGNRSIVYVKPVWRFIAFVVKHIPEVIAKRLKW